MYTSEQISDAVGKANGTCDEVDPLFVVLLPPSSGAPKTSPRSKKDQLELCDFPADVDASPAATPCHDREAEVAATASCSNLRAQPGPSGSFDGSSVGSAGHGDAECSDDETELSNMRGRLKSAAYWMRSITFERAWRQSNMSRKFTWAESCVARVSKTDVLEAACPNLESRINIEHTCTLGLAW